MAGNVREWVADWLSDTYYSVSPTSNPTGPVSGTQKVRRGGSWLDASAYVRVADRGVNAAGTTYFGLGFRCAGAAP